MVVTEIANFTPIVMAKDGSPPELPPAERLVWMLGAAAVNIIWGLHPVFTRWLQLHTRIPTMSLVRPILFECVQLVVLTNAVGLQVFVVLLVSFCLNMAASTLSAPAPVASEPKEGQWRVGAGVALVYAARSSTNFLSASYTQVRIKQPSILVLSTRVPFNSCW